MESGPSALAIHDAGAAEKGLLAAARVFFRDLLGASARRARGAGRAPGPRNTDYAALKAIVKQRGLLERRPVYYVLIMVMNAAILAAGVAWIAATRASAWVWLAAPLLAFVSGQLGLLGHEAGHRAVFAGARANDALGLICMNLLFGGSYRWWVDSHDEHHARSNDPERDPDIDYPMLAFSEAQARSKDPVFRPLLRCQHWLSPLLMCFVGVSLRAYSFADFVRRGARCLDLAACAAYWVAYPSLLVAALGVGRGLLFMAAHQALFGLYLGSVTAVNHWGMPMPGGGGGLDFLRRQAITSRNLRGGVIADVWYGGLNRQIEHHLFPTMARHKLAEARPIVRAFCEARGVAYHEVSIVEGYREMFTTMREVASAVRGFDASEIQPRSRAC